MSRLKADRKENQRRRGGSEEKVVLKPGRLNPSKYKEQIHRKPWMRRWWEEDWVGIPNVKRRARDVALLHNRIHSGAPVLQA